MDGDKCSGNGVETVRSSQSGDGVGKGTNFWVQGGDGDNIAAVSLSMK